MTWFIVADNLEEMWLRWMLLVEKRNCGNSGIIDDCRVIPVVAAQALQHPENGHFRIPNLGRLSTTTSLCLTTLEHQSSCVCDYISNSDHSTASVIILGSTVLRYDLWIHAQSTLFSFLDRPCPEGVTTECIRPDDVLWPVPGEGIFQMVREREHKRL